MKILFVSSTFRSFELTFLPTSLKSFKTLPWHFGILISECICNLSARSDTGFVTLFVTQEETTQPRLKFYVLTLSMSTLIKLVTIICSWLWIHSEKCLGLFEQFISRCLP